MIILSKLDTLTFLDSYLEMWIIMKIFPSDYMQTCHLGVIKVNTKKIAQLGNS